jgi:hypothetical protein
VSTKLKLIIASIPFVLVCIGIVGLTLSIREYIPNNIEAAEQRYEKIKNTENEINREKLIEWFRQDLEIKKSLYSLDQTLKELIKITSLLLLFLGVMSFWQCMTILKYASKAKEGT